jgi:hypothetical protein
MVWFFGKIYTAWTDEQYMQPMPMQVEEPGTPPELPAVPAVEAAPAAPAATTPPAATTQSLLEAVQASVLIAEAVSPAAPAATTAPAAPAATSAPADSPMEDSQLAADEVFAEKLQHQENIMGSTGFVVSGQSGGSTDVLMGTPCNKGAASWTPTSPASTPAEAVPVIHLDLGEAVNAMSQEADSDLSSIGFYSSELCPNNKALPAYIGFNWRFVASFVWDYQTTKADALTWCQGDEEKLFG